MLCSMFLLDGGRRYGDRQIFGEIKAYFLNDGKREDKNLYIYAEVLIVV